MESTTLQRPAPLPPAGSTGYHLLALLEIVPVAIFGAMVAQAVISLAGYSVEQILAQPSLIFALLFIDATLTILLITFLLKARGQSLQDIGWKWRPFSREFALGIALIPFLFFSTMGVGVFFRLFFPDHVTTTNPLLDLLKTRQDLFYFLISSIYVGGFKEELQRAFALERFETHLGALLVGLPKSEPPEGLEPRMKRGQKAALWGGLLLWSVVFGLGHLMQGVDNAFAAGVLGLMFGMFYIWRRKLTGPIVAHAGYDIITLIVFWNIVRS